MHISVYFGILKWLFVEFLLCVCDNQKTEAIEVADIYTRCKYMLKGCEEATPQQASFMLHSPSQHLIKHISKLGFRIDKYDFFFHISHPELQF